MRDGGWSRNPVDRFILAGLEKEGLAPAAAADRRTWIRRATYDLLGLPPTPEEVEDFRNDPSPQAFEKVVDRLLDSPHYGERWGRHWLDLVRYADTAGENSDHPLPEAWRYRNWVIQAFNDDQPYDEFLRDQLAGDLVAAQGPPEEFADRVVATGYLAIARRFGHDIEKDMHLTYEDVIDNLSKTMLGVTLSCARCHDHKYDPLSMEDYYGLQGILESTRLSFPGCEPKQLPKDLVPLLPAAEVERRLEPHRRELARLEAEARQAEQRLTQQRKSLDSAPLAILGSGELAPGTSQEFAIGSTNLAQKFVDVRRGEMLQLSVLPRGNHGADSTLIELEIIEDGGSGRVWNLTRDVLPDFYESGAGMQHRDRYGNEAIWNFLDLADGLGALSEFARDVEKVSGLHAWRVPGGLPSAVVNTNTQTAKFLTVTLPGRSLAVHPGPKGGVAVAWESPIDGAVAIRGRIAEIDPGGDGVSWRFEKRPGFASGLKEERPLAMAFAKAKQEREAAAARQPAIPVAYAASETKAVNARLHLRGDPEKLGDEVPRRFPAVLGGQAVPPEQGSGRLALAQWLADPGHPLTARVMVNRIWLGHFGRGLVATANDFGTRGQPPTHPELLDWLAATFRETGWSIKAMHRLIMSSATYGQAVTQENPDRYAGFTRRRLSAEELRDTLLMASGELDRRPGARHPFPPEDKWSYTQHGPFAENYDTLQRSVYIMQKRNRRTPFFALFDGADPNASVAQRDVTTVPTQALYFLNDAFIHQRAERFAARILAAETQTGRRLEHAFRALFGRAASSEEQEILAGFLAEQTAQGSGQPAEHRVTEAWTALARVLFSSNELMHLD